MQNDYALLLIGRPAADRTDLVTLPNPTAFVWIELYLQTAQRARDMPMLIHG
jgi:hypothetical protein